MSNGMSPDPAGAAVPESAAKYRLILEASNDTLLFIDPHGVIIGANHAAETMFGYTRTELLSMKIGDLLNRRKDGTLYADHQTITPVHGSSGENTHCIVNDDPLIDLPNRTSFTGQWPARIKSALAQGNLVLHYQPIVRLSDGGIEYREALLRIKDSGEGILYPGQFLPHAFRCGLTPDLDLWVVESALQRIARSPGLRIATNLSAQTLQDHETLAAIERAVIRLRPRPGNLLFEISETAAVRDLQRVNDWIHRMRRLGCRFALDDFGTGASSFEHLRSLSLDVVKIAGGYVQQMLTDRTCMAFVEAIASVCCSLGMDVVAESVESAEVVDLLKGIGVRLGQGYFWGRPTPMSSTGE